ncbi:hypothetical protein Bpfe_028798 [Biomphalaria pfeifferi]|uniref:RING-type domain-containing protein n=1 Tax=Biomphalaria pfeifferi TaxID=112525 RepID=A0AAD8ASS6_BIOPF|nr:hypothetical protein Bpfe_028798 [Biomphalaria pfeifferi]
MAERQTDHLFLSIETCPTCKTRNPVCLVNRPCRHVTSCIQCQHLTNECRICKRVIDIFQCEFDLHRQETIT